MPGVDFVKFLTLPLRTFGALSIASGLILFSPEKFIKLLYLEGVKANYGTYIGLIFVISVSMFAVFFVCKLLKWLKEKYNIYALKRNQYQFLKHLDQTHVEFIEMFLSDPTHTMSLPPQNGLVIEMIHHLVITPAGKTHFIDPLDPKIPYFLQPWVIARIKEHADLRMQYHTQPE